MLAGLERHFQELVRLEKEILFNNRRKKGNSKE